MTIECGFCKGTKVEPGIPGPCVWCEEVGAAPVEPVVQRFSAVALRFATSTAKDYVSGADFDRVTAERDAMQQRLTAADERVDVLEGLLREVVALDPRGEVLGWQLDGKVDAALKPAEGGGDE